MLCFKKKLLNCIRENRSDKELDQTSQRCSAPLDLKEIKMAEKIIRSVRGDTLEKNQFLWEKEIA